MGTDSKTAGVVVLGMHRSGTSAVAGYLAKAGFFAGDDADLLPPAVDNPKGFFERTDVNELNDALLARVGGTWDNPPARDLVAEEAPRWRGQVERLLDSLARQSGGRPIVVKDPRVSLVLPAWLPALEDRFALVVVDRPALEVALSVRKRDGRPLFVALALWQLYCTELVHGLTGRDALVVRFQSFVANPAGTGPQLLADLSQALPPEVMAAASGTPAEGFVSSDMRHHRDVAIGRANDEALTGAQVALTDWLAGLPEGWAHLAPPEQLTAQPEQALTAVAEYYEAVGDRYGMETAYDTERHKALHFEQATELKDQHIANLESELGHLRPLVEDQRTLITELEEANAALKESKQATEDELSRLHHDGRAAATNLLSVARRGKPKAAH